MLTQMMDYRVRHRREPVFISLSLAHNDLAALEVQIRDSQAERLKQP